MTPEYLEWDSNFFKCRVGSLKVNKDEDISIANINVFDFVYFIADENISLKQKEELEKIAFFADEKIIYQKIITEAGVTDKEIVSWPKDKEPVKQLVDLGIASGEFSRFKIDPLISNEIFNDLYRLWVINSVNRKIAEEVFCYTLKDRIVGLITLGIKNDIPDIGILSVNKEFRGRGIARNLINAAEYWTKNIKNKNILQVVTQGLNSGACEFYEKCGFNIHHKKFIFHWRKKNKKNHENPL
jgi:dTDP-4-amino-4,6-dideoxy-D-galactose acyltransferase